MTKREQETLTKAASILYSLSCRVDSRMAECRLERLAESLEQILEDYSKESEE